MGDIAQQQLDALAEQLDRASKAFAEVNENKVIILADACERIDSINEKRAQEAQLKAAERIATKNESLDIERSLNSLRRADLRLKLVKKKKFREGLKINTSTHS